MAESKTIARPYAKAILASATDQKQQENWQVFLQTAKAVLEAPGVLEHLALPNFEAQLQTWLTELLTQHRKQGIQTEEQNLLKVLQEHDRIAVLPEIADIYEQLLNESRHICSVHVKSAKPLTAAEKQALEATMRKKTGRDVLLNVSEDKSLLAGVLIEYDGLVIDQSLKGRIAGFARQLDD